jgi:hypothetical protein
MPRQNIAIQPSTILIQATQRTQGDGEFFGHGPAMYLSAGLYRPTQFHVSLWASVKFRETQADWTTYIGDFDAVVYDVRSQNPRARIVNIITPGFNDEKVLEGYGVHAFQYGNAALINRIDAIGDEYGGIFGGNDHPQVTLLFNNVEIEIAQD